MLHSSITRFPDMHKKLSTCRIDFMHEDYGKFCTSFPELMRTFQDKGYNPNSKFLDLGFCLDIDLTEMRFITPMKLPTANQDRE